MKKQRSKKQVRLTNQIALTLDNLPEFLAPEDVAEVVGLSRGSIYNLWRAGQGPKRVKIGNRLLCTKASIKNWIDELK